MIGELIFDMSKTPLISVVMPVYNAEKYLSLSIDSILNQTFKDFELVIINDGSKDSSLKIIKKYKDKRIRVVNNKKNLKIAKSLNKAVKLARSNIIARADADDIYVPKRLELQYKIMIKNQKIVIVGSNMKIINEKGEKISKREYPESDKELKRLMFRYSPFGHPVVMFRKKEFLEFGGYDHNKVPCEDIDLWFKIGSKYEFATVNKYLINYRVYSGSSSNKKLKQLELLGFQVKWMAVRNYGYRLSVYDAFYNFGQFITLWVMPSKVRVWTYNFLRSNKLI